MALATTSVGGDRHGPLRPSWHRGARGHHGPLEEPRGREPHRPRDREERSCQEALPVHALTPTITTRSTISSTAGACPGSRPRSSSGCSASGWGGTARGGSGPSGRGTGWSGTRSTAGGRGWAWARPSQSKKTSAPPSHPYPSSKLPPPSRINTWVSNNWKMYAEHAENSDVEDNSSRQPHIGLYINLKHLSFIQVYLLGYNIHDLIFLAISFIRCFS